METTFSAARAFKKAFTQMVMSLVDLEQVKVVDGRPGQDALAWDDIDDPHEQPTGWAYTPRGPHDRDELLTDLVESGAGLTAALGALNLSRDALERWAERHDRRSDYVTLARRESPAREAS